MKIEKKYGLLTAICMVVGVVIGSGIFFKAQTILQKTEGNTTIGILAWIIGGLIMVACASAFSIMATKYEKFNGLVDYAEVVVGKKFAYMIGWFCATIYIPAMTGVLAWVSARYLGELFGFSLNSAEVMVLGALFLVGVYVLNTLAPKIAGKFQVSTTFIKLIPILLMAIVGLVYGLTKSAMSYEVVGDTIQKVEPTQMQILIENFKNSGNFSMKLLLAAVVSSSFAYEGWIVATSINAELKNSKKNLPIALFIGSLIIVAIYVLYYVGVLGGATVDVLKHNNGGAPYAFLQIFGDVFGTILKVFIVVSCLGTLNGLMLSNVRCIYALSSRNMGPKPEVFNEVDNRTNIPTNSAVFGLLMAIIWFTYFYGANLTSSWFGAFSFDSSELPIVTIYALYIPIFIMMIVKERKSFGIFKGIILPILAIIACAFMVFAAIYSHGMACFYYFIVFLVIMGIGAIFLFIKKKNNAKEELYDDLLKE